MDLQFMLEWQLVRQLAGLFMPQWVPSGWHLYQQCLCFVQLFRFCCRNAKEALAKVLRIYIENRVVADFSVLALLAFKGAA